MQALYAWQQADLPADKGKELLNQSLFSTYEMFMFLLEMPLHFRDYLNEEADREKAKYYPDKERIRRLRFLSNSAVTEQYYQASGFHTNRFFKGNWNTQHDFFKTLIGNLETTEFLSDYLIFDTHELEQEKEFFEAFWSYLFEHSDSFQQVMEDLYPAWDDDIEVLYRELIKTTKSAQKNMILSLPKKLDPLHEDVEFAVKTFNAVTSRGEEMTEDIKSVTENWDPGRIAVLDLIAIKMALAEFLLFPLIPVKVTINEYLEIIKDYSTPGSSRFLNGILDKLRIKLEKEERIQKSGRGLRDN